MFAGLTNHIFWWMEGVEENQEEKFLTSTEDTTTTVRSEKEKSIITVESREKEMEVFPNDTKQAGATGDSSEYISTEPEKETDISQMNDTITKVKLEFEPFQEPKERDSADDAGPAVPQPISESECGHQNDQTPEVHIEALTAVGSFGSFLYSAFKKAEKALTEASVKIKETVVNNNILGQFNEEQNAFIRGKNENLATALLPWIGCPNEETLKDEILSLSTDRRNFVRNPPVGVDFQFDYGVSYPIAITIMEHDPELEKMRYELVPKVVSEQEFWRNYFYRLSLICQANELSSSLMKEDSQCVTKTYVSEMETLALVTESNDTEWENELQAELLDYELGDVKIITNADLNGEIDVFLREDTDAK